MEHSYFQDRLSAYHDNELPLQEKVVVEQHLRDCPECQEQLANYAHLDRLVIDHSQLDDSGYWEKSARNIEKEISLADTSKFVSVPAVRRNWALIWKLAAVAASVVIIGYFGFHRDQIFPPEKVVPLRSAPAVSRPNPTPAVVPGTADSAATLGANSGSLTSKNDELIQQPKEKRDESLGGTAAKSGDLALQEQPPYQGVKGKAAMTPAPLADSKSSEKQTTLDRIGAPAPELAKNESANAPVAVAPALKASRQVDKLAAQLQNIRESNAAVAIPANDSLGAISYWRSLRDSLAASGNQKEVFHLNADKEPASRYQTSDKKVQSVVPASIVKSRDVRLAEAWYQIARLTTSDSEKTVATDALKALAGGSSAAVKQRAQSYLDSLGGK